jgi:anti-sigma regulatory factor (Ser/Thr protein kinase)
MTLKYHHIRRDLEDVQAALDVSSEADRQISHALDELIERVLRLAHAKAPGKVIAFAARSQGAQR